MDDGGGDDSWRGPLLFGAAALSLVGITHLLNRRSDPRNEQEAAQRIMEDSDFEKSFHKTFDAHHDDMSIPPEYLDPISHHIMEDPVILSDGQTYNRNTAEYLLKYHKPSPLTRAELVQGYIEPNERLKSEIDSWIIALKYQFNKMRL